MIRVVVASLFWALAMAISGGLQGVEAQATGQPQQQQYPIIRQLAVVGTERVEAATILSYVTVRVGDPFDPVEIDRSLKSLFATGLFSDVEMQEENGVLIIRVVENPIINRIIFEGNKKIKREDFIEEIRLRPRQVFTRAKVRADVQRMLTLYQRKGRFAAVIEPKVVRQDQNRVDLVFEIQEGPRSRIGKINFIGNKKYSDGDLRDVLVSKQARWWKLFTSNDTFDPDRQAYDQQLLREFYLNEGYADFRTLSAVAELTPDREDFLITFTVEEGEIYEFGEITVESEIRNVKSEFLQAFIAIGPGQIYSRERIEQTVEGLQALAGQLGYAFVDVRPQFTRNREARTIDINFVVLDAPRVYVERINIGGNVRTLDRVVRREFRIQEGDAFNSAAVERSEARLNRLNFFRSVEVSQSQGSEPDRIVLDVAVEEQSTGQLNVGAGYASFQGLVFNFSIAQQNLLGTGQNAQLALQYSGVQQSLNLSFTEPYFQGRRVAAGFDLFVNRRDNSAFQGRGINVGPQFIESRNQFGGSLRLGAAISEYWTLSPRYVLRRETTTLDAEGSANVFQNDLLSRQQFEDESDEDYLLRISQTNFDGQPIDLNGDGMVTEEDYDRNQDGTITDQERFFTLDQFLVQDLGARWQSIIGFQLATDTRNSFLRPTRGRALIINTDFAGLGGDVSYLRTRVNYDQYWTPFAGWTFRASGEGGIIEPLGGQVVRAADRFYIGGPRIRGFNNAGIGPRRLAPGALQGQPLGATAYYIGRAELFFPLGELALESGVAASAFMDLGSAFRAQSSVPDCPFDRVAYDLALVDGDFSSITESFVSDTNPNGVFTTCIAGNSPAPRLSVGVGVSWQSPFGPFRIDLAHVIESQPGDFIESLQFNVGTTF